MRALSLHLSCAAYKCSGTIRQQIRQIPIRVADIAIVLTQRVVVVARIAMQSMELMPAGWNFSALVLIEIFAGEECAVSTLLQQHGQCTRLESLTPLMTIAAAAQGIVQGAMIVCILSCQQARS